MILNEILFYGGIAAGIITLIGAVIFYVAFYISKIKLEAKFDEEYGKRIK